MKTTEIANVLEEWNIECSNIVVELGATTYHLQSGFSLKVFDSNTGNNMGIIFDDGQYLGYIMWPNFDYAHLDGLANKLNQSVSGSTGFGERDLGYVLMNLKRMLS